MGINLLETVRGPPQHCARMVAARCWNWTAALFDTVVSCLPKDSIPLSKRALGFAHPKPPASPHVPRATPRPGGLPWSRAAGAWQG